MSEILPPTPPSPEARRPPMPMIRMASSQSELEHKQCCMCDELVMGGLGNLRLQCRCLLHYTCLVQYIRSKSSLYIRQFNGIACPYAVVGACEYDGVDEYRITPEDMDGLIDYIEAYPAPSATSGAAEVPTDRAAGSDDIHPLTHEEVEKIRGWIIDAQSIPQPLENEANDSKISSEQTDRPLMIATTKPCPSCTLRTTHYQGHGCHHVQGCPQCRLHWCYKCSASQTENKKVRGSDSHCKCGGWSTFCQNEDILKHLVFTPYPYDDRCGCPICPDCRPNKACPTCPGSCPVCRGIIQPGPDKLVKEGEWKHLSEAQRKAAELEAKKHLIENYKRQMVQIITNNQADQIYNFLEELRSSDTIDFINMLDNRGNTPLSLACQMGHINIIRALLIVPELDINRRDRSGQHAIHVAVVHNRLEVVEILLSSESFALGVDVTCLNTQNRSALDLAVNHNPDAQIINFLLSRPHFCTAELIKSALFEAISKNSTALVSLLIRCNECDINAADADGNTALMKAAQSSRADILYLLLERPDILVNLTNNSGMSALCTAAAAGNQDIVESLLTIANIDLNQADNTGMSPLLWAASRNKTPVALSLLNKEDTNIQWIDGSGKTALMYACSLGNVQLCERILEFYRGTDNAADNPDQTTTPPKGKTTVEIIAAYLISKFPAEEIVCSLTEGVPLSLPYGMLRKDDHCTTLDCTEEQISDIITAVFNPPETASAGRRGGASMGSYSAFSDSLNFEDGEGQSALFYAVSRKSAAIVKMLLDIPFIEVNASTNEKRALYEAFRVADDDVCALLLQRPDILGWESVYEKTKESFLTTCSNKNLPKSAKALLLKGCNANHRNAKGMTALTIAASQGKLEMCKVFRNFNVNMNYRNGAGMTALMLAITSNQEATAKFLLETPSVKLHLQDNYGMTALMHACRLNNKVLAMCILEETSNRGLSRSANIMLGHSLGRSALTVTALKSNHQFTLELLNIIHEEHREKSTEAKKKACLKHLKLLLHKIQGGMSDKPYRDSVCITPRILITEGVPHIDDLFTWEIVMIWSSEASPWASSVTTIYVEFSLDYPTVSPSFRLVSDLPHPNFSMPGWISADLSDQHAGDNFLGMLDHLYEIFMDIPEKYVINEDWGSAYGKSLAAVTDEGAEVLPPLHMSLPCVLLSKHNHTLRENYGQQDTPDSSICSICTPQNTKEKFSGKGYSCTAGNCKFHACDKCANSSKNGLSYFKAIQERVSALWTMVTRPAFMDEALALQQLMALVNVLRTFSQSAAFAFRDSMGSFVVLKIIFNAMKGNAQIVENCLYVLSIICEPNAVVKKTDIQGIGTVLSSLGFFELVMEATSLHIAVSETTSAACNTFTLFLGNVSEAAGILINSGLFKVIISILNTRANDYGVVLMAMGILANGLAANTDCVTSAKKIPNLLQLLIDADFIPTLVKLLELYSSDDEFCSLLFSFLTFTSKMSNYREFLQNFAANEILVCGFISMAAGDGLSESTQKAAAVFIATL